MRALLNSLGLTRAPIAPAEPREPASSTAASRPVDISAPPLAIDDFSGRPKSDMPTIVDAARFYQAQTGPTGKFLQTSKSFGVEIQIRRDDQLLIDYAVDRTPTIVPSARPHGRRDRSSSSHYAHRAPRARN
jgi:hypothetical protein